MYFSNRGNVPSGKPVLLACNHPNSFLDGVAISYLMSRRTFVLVRGDVFKKKWANSLLRSMCLLPIFRESDGQNPRENRAKNDQTFDECYALFKKNSVVLIFSEAIAKIERRLRPIKKGTARLAFDAAVKSNWTMDLHIVPSTLNYSHFRGFRKELMIDFCRSIRVADYRDLYEQNPNQAIINLTADIEEVLKNNTVICENPETDDLFEMYSKMVRNEIRKPLFGFLFFHNRPLKSEVLSAAEFNAIMRNEAESQTFKTNIQDYYNTLSKYELNDKAVKGIYGIWWKVLFLIAFTLPAIAGMLFVWLPYWLASGYTPKLVRRKEFYDSVLLGLSLVFDLLYTIILAVILYLLFGMDFWWILAVIKVTGIFSLLVWETWGDVLQAFRYALYKRSNSTDSVSLLRLRSEILKQG
jgi:1-acyl-sn-glycerol-3-phosphate acyltransferase